MTDRPADTYRLTGLAALAYLREDPCRRVISKYADPTEGAREGITLAEAEEIAAEDPALLYKDLPSVGCQEPGCNAEAVYVMVPGDLRIAGLGRRCYQHSPAVVGRQVA